MVFLACPEIPARNLAHPGIPGAEPTAGGCQRLVPALRFGQGRTAPGMPSPSRVPPDRSRALALRGYCG